MLAARVAVVMLALTTSSCTYWLWDSAWNMESESTAVSGGRLLRIWRLDPHEAVMEVELGNARPLLKEAKGSDHRVLLRCSYPFTPIGDELSTLCEQLAGRHTSSASWRITFDDRRVTEHGVEQWDCSVFLAGSLDCSSSADAPASDRFRRENDAPDVVRAFLAKNSWRWEALGDRDSRLYCPIDADENAVAWDRADDLLRRRELGLVLAASRQPGWHYVTVPAELMRLEPIPEVRMSGTQPRWQWSTWVYASVGSDAPPTATPLRSTPLAVEFVFETVSGPGFLDFAWRVPVSFVTIPLDLVFAVPVSILILALPGVGH
jgi:hypothetical protein